jgi:hypothetical protein
MVVKQTMNKDTFEKLWLNQSAAFMIIGIFLFGTQSNLSELLFVCFLGVTTLLVVFSTAR